MATRRSRAAPIRVPIASSAACSRSIPADERRADSAALNMSRRRFWCGAPGQKEFSAFRRAGQYGALQRFVPLVYGTQWHVPDVVFSRNDGNLTRWKSCWAWARSGHPQGPGERHRDSAGVNGIEHDVHRLVQPDQRRHAKREQDGNFARRRRVFRWAIPTAAWLICRSWCRTGSTMVPAFLQFRYSCRA